MYLQSKYTKWYDQIISRARLRVLPDDVYTEKHHIIPDCFYANRHRKGAPGWLPGDPNSADNIVRLTAREHLVCHMLLVRMTTGVAKKKMWIALFRLCHGVASTTLHVRHRIPSVIYEKAKVEIAAEAAIRASIVHKGRKRTNDTKVKLSIANTGKKRTEEQKERQRKSQLSRNYQHDMETRERIRQAGLGREVAQETRERIRSALKGRTGEVHSDETKSKMSKAQRARGQKGKPGKPHTDEARAKIAAAGTGRKHSQESIEKMRQKKIGVRFSDETRAKMSAQRKGVKRGPMLEETKKKIGEANRLRRLERISADQSLKDEA